MGPPQCPRDTLGIPSVPTGPPQCPRGLAGRSCARLPEGHTPGLARPEGRAGTAPQRPGAPLGTRGKEKAQTSHGSGSERGKGREGKAPTSRSRRRRRCASSGTCWRLGTAGSGSAGTAGTAGAARCRDPSAARAAAPSAAALAHAHTNSTKKVISFSRRGHGLFATSRCKYRISPSGWTTGSAARTPCHPRTSNTVSPTDTVSPTNTLSRGRTRGHWGQRGGSASSSVSPKCQRCSHSTRLAPWYPSGARQGTSH